MMLLAGIAEAARAIKVAGYKLAPQPSILMRRLLSAARNYLLLIILYLAAGYTSELLRTATRCFKEVERTLSDDDGAQRERMLQFTSGINE